MGGDGEGGGSGGDHLEVRRMVGEDGGRTARTARTADVSKSDVGSLVTGVKTLMERQLASWHFD